MALSEQAIAALTKEAESHKGRKLVRLLKFMRAGAPMLQLAFEGPIVKEIKFSTHEGRDYLFDKMKELYWWKLPRP